jgi:hypothetical protein
MAKFIKLGNAWIDLERIESVTADSPDQCAVRFHSGAQMDFTKDNARKVLKCVTEKETAGDDWAKGSMKDG